MADWDDTFGDDGAAGEIGETLTRSARTFSSLVSSGLKKALVDGQSLEKVLKRAALSFANRSLSAGIRPLTNLVGQSVGGATGGIGSSLASRLAGSALKAIPFAEGGVIGSPTAFQLPGARVGLMGEAGREAVLPLARGTDGRLGVALEGSDARQPGIVVNVQTADAESFRRSEQQVTAILARAVARGRRGL